MSNLSYPQEESDIMEARSTLTTERIAELTNLRRTVRRFITTNFNKMSVVIAGSNRMMMDVIETGEKYVQLWDELELLEDTEEGRTSAKEYTIDIHNYISKTFYFHIQFHIFLFHKFIYYMYITY